MPATRVPFVMEQTLGHITHYQNLRAAASRQSRVEPIWMPVPFDTTRVGRLLPAYGGNWSVRASFRARRQLARQLESGPVEALFFHTQVTALFSEAVMRRHPTVISLDATPANFDTVGAAYGHHAATGGWLDQRKFELNRRVFHAARALVTWSEWAKRSLVSDYGVSSERISVIPPGAASAYFSIGEQRQTSRSADAPVRLLFVGGDFTRKGGHLLLASARAVRTHRAFEIHVVTRERVAPAPGVHVHNDLGPNSPGLIDLFREADVFVLPTDGDCLGIVVMEASAAGLPIITTNVGAMREAAIPARNAIVMKPGDGIALRRAIESLVDGDSLRTALSRGGRELALARFDADRNAMRIFDVIQAVANPAAKRSVA